MHDAKRNGGQGISYSDVFNEALLGKWLRRYALECNYLGRKILQGKRREMEGGLSILDDTHDRKAFGMPLGKAIRRAFGMPLGKAIRRAWEEFSLFVLNKWVAERALKE